MDNNGEVPDDETPDYCDEQPEEGDYVLTDAPPLGSRTSVSVVGGKHLGTYNDFDAAMRAIRADMKQQRCWPDVWACSDHGNLFLVAEELPDEED